MGLDSIGVIITFDWGEKNLLWNTFCFILMRPARLLEQAPRKTGAIRRIVATDKDKTMKMIQPNCRAQFAAEDVEFILSVLGGKTLPMTSRTTRHHLFAAYLVLFF